MEKWVSGVGRTFFLEGEIFCELSAFMVAAQESEGLGIPEFETVEVEQALES